MKNTSKKKLEEAIQNAEHYIEQMKVMDDKKLMKHLDLFREQMQRAYVEKKLDAYELLYEYEKQVIIARLSKT